MGETKFPAYQLDQADVIVSFGGDFLEAWPSPVYYSRLFGDFRQGPRRTQGEHGRFIYVGPRMSMTAAKADLWLPCNPGTEAIVASAIAAALTTPGVSLARAGDGFRADRSAAHGRGGRCSRRQAPAPLPFPATGC